MDPVWYSMLVTELAKPLGQIAENLTFILDELRKLALPDGTRRRIVAMSERFRSAARDSEIRVVEVSEKVDAEDPLSALRPIVPRLEEEMRAYDALVHEVRSLPTASALPEVLLNESGANILGALADLRGRLASLEAEPPDRTEERHVLPCSACEGPAVGIDLHVNRRTGQRVLRYSGITGAYDLPMTDEVLGWVRARDVAALHGRDELVDAYCPACQKVYCRQHYHVEETYDEGFHESTYGTCPGGHRKIID